MDRTTAIVLVIGIILPAAFLAYLLWLALQ